MKNWIDCCGYHRSCPESQVGKLPRRVIDVSLFDIDQTVKLHQTSNEQERYVALSYCWGQAPHVVTTSANIDELSKSITASSLPKTIQDAISVTIRLGFKYLWIDALVGHPYMWICTLYCY
jgi:hypothetical protein